MKWRCTRCVGSVCRCGLKRIARTSCNAEDQRGCLHIAYQVLDIYPADLPMAYHMASGFQTQRRRSVGISVCTESTSNPQHTKYKQDTLPHHQPSTRQINLFPSRRFYAVDLNEWDHAMAMIISSKWMTSFPNHFNHFYTNIRY